MFFDVRYRFKKKDGSDNEIHEKSVRIEGKDGKPATPKELVMMCYKTYARRDVEVIDIKAAMYLPKLLDIGTNDEGLITINGRPFDVGQEISEREIPGLPSMSISPSVSEATPASAPQEAITQPQAPVESIQQVSAPKNDINRREEIIFQGPDRAKLDADEKRWQPSRADKSQGVTMVATYSPARLMVFDPPGSAGDYAHFPLQKGERVYVGEKMWRGRNAFFSCQASDGRTVMIPEELVVASNDKVQVDPMLDIQDNRPDRGNFIDTSQGEGETVYNSVPLQRGDDLRSSGRQRPSNLPSGAGVVRSDGMIDIEQIELRRR